MGRMTQWHPIFAQLLRPAVEAYYQVQPTVPVGDAPREADFVLLRRTSAGATSFRGPWRHLTLWNILEVQGPHRSSSPRRCRSARRTRPGHRPPATHGVSTAKAKAGAARGIVVLVSREPARPTLSARC